MLQKIKDETDQQAGEGLIQSVTGIAFAGKLIIPLSLEIE